jgi:hypothetical protein
MPFTVVIPSLFQTNRADLQDAIQAMVSSFQTAHRHGFETVTHDAGLRVTTFTGSIVYVDTLAFAPETNDRSNVFLDYMRDLFSANAQVFSTGILEETGVTEAELPWGPSVETTGTALLWRFVIQEGRD